MQEKIRFVVPTKKNKNDYTLTKPGICLNSVDTNYITILHNNNQGLPKIYNQILETDTDSDIIVFMHDDVEIHDRFILDKLKKAHEIYDIVGLAGAETQDYNKSLAWHTASESNKLHGFVSHVIPAKYSPSKTPYVNSTFFGPTPSEVCVIDGLFISINMKKCRELGKIPKFNDIFDFHFYDLSFCADAQKQGLTIGVYPIFVIHYGLGDSMNSESWKFNAHLFQKNYK